MLYGLIMYIFHNKLMWLSKLVEVTDIRKNIYYEICAFYVNTNPACFIVLASAFTGDDDPP